MPDYPDRKTVAQQHHGYQKDQGNQRPIYETPRRHAAAPMNENQQIWQIEQTSLFSL